MKKVLTDFAPYLGLATTNEKLKAFLFEFDGIDSSKIKIKEDPNPIISSKKMQYELYFEEIETIDPITSKPMVCFRGIGIPLDKPYKSGLIELPVGIHSGMQRDEVLPLLGKPSASYERNGVLLNNRWFYDTYKILIPNFPDGIIKSIFLGPLEN